MTSLAEARAQFPVLERIAYLNAGTFGPLARSTVAALREELERDLEDGRSGMPYFLRALALREEARAALAELVGVGAASVALTSSTTDGCNIVLAGLGLGARDEVVTTTDEHPGLLLPLHASGARVVPVAPDTDAILAAVTPRTRLIAVSQVLWTTGAVLPVHELRAASGVPLLVDGAQAVGAIPVDASGIDFLTISGQKWLCGPDATGALVVADVDALRVASPSYFAQSSFEPDGAFVARDGAARFEPNWWSCASLRGLLAALRTRPAWWHQHAVAIAERCRTLLAERYEVV
ncbi:MAG: aminotransferase class V-fold PLP-dependent enzyme, partial [Gaiella sp.]